MPEDSRNLTASGENNMTGPDYFGFYTSEIQELLSQDDGLLPFSHPVFHSARNFHEVGREKGSTKTSYRSKENNANIGPASLFSNGIGALLSEFKKERLKSVLRQSVFTLTPEVDEMINPVSSICRIRSCLRHKESLLSSDDNTCKADKPQHPDKKRKLSPACPIDDDLRFILENDSNKVEELMESHCTEISDMLHHMEQKLEELLNSLMTSCRTMTLPEKQQLRKLIQKLPPKNLDRITEIIAHNKPSEKHSSDEVHVDLDEVDNVTLWRLYFYVATIQATGGVKKD